MKISHSGFNVMKITLKWLERKADEGEERERERRAGRVSTFFIRSPSTRIPQRSHKQMEFYLGPFIIK